MLTLLISIALYALSTPPTGPAAFDQARARAHYESFFYDFLKSDWPADDSGINSMEKSAKRQRPPVKVSPWPIDSTRGLYCNSTARLTQFKWVAVGLDKKPRPSPFSDLDLCALSSMSNAFMWDFTDDIAPELCVERPGTHSAYQGAAACYFAVRSAEYSQAGFWVALREVDGKVVIAGILEHKEFMDEPEKDRRLKPFLDAIEKRFGPAPAPKTTKPGKQP